MRKNKIVVRNDALFTQIAKEYFEIDTLELRNRDALDFHEVSVVALKKALEAAFLAGLKQNGK